MRAEATDGLGFAPPALAAPSAEPLAGPFAGTSDAAFAAPGALEIFLAFFTDLRFVTTRFAPDRARRAYSGAMTSTPPM